MENEILNRRCDWCRTKTFIICAHWQYPNLLENIDDGRRCEACFEESELYLVDSLQSECYE